MANESAKRGPAKIVRKQSVVIECAFEVVTPMFGGGVHIDEARAHQKKPDPITPVRAASVRGQLRFWWRATHAHRFATLAELRAEEARLWGAASQPARVAIEVTGGSPRPEDVFRWVQGGNGRWNLYPLRGFEARSYGAFPLRPGIPHPEPPGALTRIVGECHLRLTLADSDEPTRHTVEEAVRAWLLFGGVGGRTRRGFGAVCATDGDRADLERLLGGLGSGKPVAGVPALVGARWKVSTSTSQSATAALESALARLQRFRQGPGFARNPGGRDERRPGRSLWPEPDTIRAITGNSTADHRTPLGPVRKFPRAAFGMPIIFQFKDQGDPLDTELRPTGRERRASPLILRPIRDGSQFRGLALVLSELGRASEGLDLRELRGGRRTVPVESQLTPDEARAVRPLNGNPDPLDAFLNFFATNP